jgi:hypothetical protein
MAVGFVAQYVALGLAILSNQYGVFDGVGHKRLESTMVC